VKPLNNAPFCRFLQGFFPAGRNGKMGHKSSWGKFAEEISPEAGTEETIFC